MDYLRVHNWEKWQSYRADRGQPPWIKVHRQIMRHIEWVALSDAERGQLVSIWLLAADHNGVIPASPDIIQKLCFLTTPPDIERLISLGFIDKKPVKRDQIETNDDSSASNRRQDVTPKAETETEKNREENNSRFEKFKTLVLSFNDRYPMSMLFTDGNPNGQQDTKSFFGYWTETNLNGKKMRYEMQKTFDVSKRLATWSNNNREGNNGRTSGNTKPTTGGRVKKYTRPEDL